MQIEATAVQLRPRPMFEAADLGVRLVQAHAAALRRCVGPVHAVLVLLAAALYPLAPWAPMLALWLAKPVLDRCLLFVLARAVFRQPSHWADLWAARSRVLGAGLLSDLTWRRGVPWRSFSLPALQLEGLQGAQRRRRLAQLRRGHQGAALGMATAFWNVESALMIGLPGLVLWLVPGGEMRLGFDWLMQGGDGVTHLALFVLYAGVVATVEPFFVGAGFAMYLNRRVELEAWDVEQSLRQAFHPLPDAASGPGSAPPWPAARPATPGLKSSHATPAA